MKSCKINCHQGKYLFKKKQHLHLQAISWGHFLNKVKRQCHQTLGKTWMQLSIERFIIIGNYKLKSRAAIFLLIVLCGDSFLKLNDRTTTMWKSFGPQMFSKNNDQPQHKLVNLYSRLLGAGLFWNLFLKEKVSKQKNCQGLVWLMENYKRW